MGLVVNHLVKTENGHTFIIQGTRAEAEAAKLNGAVQACVAMAIGETLPKKDRRATAHNIPFQSFCEKTSRTKCAQDAL